jgi:hypothetical protein
MPPDLAAKIAAMGRVVDPENTAKLYGPLQEKTSLTEMPPGSRPVWDTQP